MQIKTEYESETMLFIVFIKTSDTTKHFKPIRDFFLFNFSATDGSTIIKDHLQQRD